MLAVSVIGLAYSDAIDPLALSVAAACLAVLAVFDRLREWHTGVYIAVGLVLWVATVESGLHPAIAGMAAGLLVGAYSPRRDEVERAAAISSAFRQSRMPRIGRSAAQSLQRVISINERAQEALHPISGFVIVPLFALANAGVDLRGGLLEDALGSPVTWGVILGLVVGKLAGISLASLGAARLGLGTVLEGVGNGQVVGGAALSGIGFTVSLLIAGLAFSSPQLQDEATVGVLVAGVLSFALGWVAFRLAAVLRGETTATRPMLLDRAVTPGRDHVRGPAAALLTLVEYGDFECPFCGAATGVVRELRQRFGDDMRYVFRHLPLTDVHPHAELAAAASEAAAAQGRFWEMHDVLFEHQDELQLEDLIGYAGKLDLDTEEFTRALTEGRYDERVREDAMSAEASGARGTPTFFVGHMRHEGAFDTASLARKLELLRPDTLLPMFEPLDAPDGEAAGPPTP